MVPGSDKSSAMPSDMFSTEKDYDTRTHYRGVAFVCFFAVSVARDYASKALFEMWLTASLSPSTSMIWQEWLGDLFKDIPAFSCYDDDWSPKKDTQLLVLLDATNKFQYKKRTHVKKSLGLEQRSQRNTHNKMQALKSVEKTHSIIVWHIYLHLVNFYGKIVGINICNVPWIRHGKCRLKHSDEKVTLPKNLHSTYQTAETQKETHLPTIHFQVPIARFREGIRKEMASFKRKCHLPTIHFQVRTVSFREGNPKIILW